jgi:subtilase family serine protease
MKKVKSILLVGLVVAMFIPLPIARAMRNLPAVLALPDLVVIEISAPNLDSGVITVRVKNQGNAPAASCYLALSVSPVGDKGKVFSPKVPALAAGEEATIEVKTGMLLSQAAFVATVDRSNTVKESNEKNNSRRGRFGGKP